MRRGDGRLGMAEAYVRAREADSLAAFGGIVGLNRPIDVETAEAISSTFIEAVIAPAVDDERARHSGHKGQHARRRRPISHAAATRRRCEVRSILGAVLVQERDHVTEARTTWTRSRPEGCRS